MHKVYMLKEIYLINTQRIKSFIKSLVTLVGLFITRIIIFSYNKFRKFCTLLQLSWSNTLRLKSLAIWNFLFDFFVLWMMQFRNFSKCSDDPFGGLYKTLMCFDLFCKKFYWNRFYIGVVNTKVWLRLKVYGIFYVNRNPTPFSIVSDLMNAFIMR